MIIAVIVMMITGICFLHYLITREFFTVGSVTSKKNVRILYFATLSFFAAYFINHFSTSVRESKEILDMLIELRIGDFLGAIIGYLFVTMFAAFMFILFPFVIINHFYYSTKEILELRRKRREEDEE